MNETIKDDTKYDENEKWDEGVNEGKWIRGWFCGLCVNDGDDGMITMRVWFLDVVSEWVNVFWGVCSSVSIGVSSGVFIGVV